MSWSLPDEPASAGAAELWVYDPISARLWRVAQVRNLTRRAGVRERDWLFLACRGAWHAG
ncbi:hypothetical protein [Geodermatophilus sp. SYSU D00815]